MLEISLFIYLKKKPAHLWNMILWTEETNINLYQNDGKRRVMNETKGIQKHTTLIVKHGRGSVMAWATTSNRNGLMVLFINDLAANRSTKMNSELYRAIIICSHATKCCKTDRTVFHSYTNGYWPKTYHKKGSLGKINWKCFSHENKTSQKNPQTSCNWRWLQ